MYSMIATAVPRRSKSSSHLPLRPNNSDPEGNGPTADPKKGKSTSQLPLPSNIVDLEGNCDVAVVRGDVCSYSSTDSTSSPTKRRSPQHMSGATSPSSSSLDQRQLAATTTAPSASKTKKSAKRSSRKQSVKQQALRQQRQNQRHRPRNDIGPFPHTTRATRRSRLLRSRASRSKENVVDATGLMSHEDRWAAMSNFAGSHRQDPHVLDLSNRCLPPQALRYGVPPQAADVVRVLKYDGNSVGQHDLPEFLDTVATMFPNLESLSMSGNPCSLSIGQTRVKSSSFDSSSSDSCYDDEGNKVMWKSRGNKPDLTIKAANEELVRMQRLYILYRLPDLKVLDGVEVKDSERELARPSTLRGSRVNRKEWVTKAMLTVAKENKTSDNEGRRSHPSSENGEKLGKPNNGKLMLLDEGDAVEVSLCGLIDIAGAASECFTRGTKHSIGNFKENTDRARSPRNNTQIRREQFLTNSNQAGVIEEAHLTPPRRHIADGVPSKKKTNLAKAKLAQERSLSATSSTFSKDSAANSEIMKDKANDARKLDSDPFAIHDDVAIPNLDLKEEHMPSDKSGKNESKGKQEKATPPRLAPRIAAVAKQNKKYKADQDTVSLSSTTSPTDNNFTGNSVKKQSHGIPRGSRPPPSPSSTLRRFPQQSAVKGKAKNRTRRRRSRRILIVPERSMVDLDEDDEDEEEDSDEESIHIEPSDSNPTTIVENKTAVKSKQPPTRIDSDRNAGVSLPKCGVALQCCS